MSEEIQITAPNGQNARVGLEKDPGDDPDNQEYDYRDNVEIIDTDGSSTHRKYRALDDEDYGNKGWTYVPNTAWYRYGGQWVPESNEKRIEQINEFNEKSFGEALVGNFMALFK